MIWNHYFSLTGSIVIEKWGRSWERSQFNPLYNDIGKNKMTKWLNEEKFLALLYFSSPSG